MRLIVWTTAVAGTVLLGFGIANGYAHYRIKIRSVDDRLSGVAMILHRLPPGRHAEVWGKLWRMLEPISDRSFGGSLQLMIYGKDEEILFKSPEWPEELRHEALPPVLLPAPPEQARPPFGPDWEEPLRDAIRRRGGRDFGPGMREPLGQLKAPEYVSRSSDDGEWRVGVLEFPGYNALLAVDLDSVMREWNHVTTAVVWTFPLALLALAIGAGFIASRAIAPIRKLSESAEKVSAAHLSKRIEMDGEDVEFEDLINVFNAMLGRLERSFEQASRFSADAAHELKTPLAILQGNLEIALNEAQDGSALQRQLSGLLDETQRLKSITTKLLLLAQADSGSLTLNTKSVRLAELIEEAVDEIEMLFPEVAVHQDLDRELRATVDGSLVEQIIRNLLTNAGKYNLAENGKIWVALKSDEAAAVIQVANTGDPIPSAQRESLFERFTRLDAARSRAVDGLGLGLSLAREFARAHGGDVALLPEEPGVIRFEVRLPLLAH